MLGGVGVWNVSRAFVEQKRKTVAVLKCLGASGNRIIVVYLLQILTLGLIGSAFGIVLAQLGLWFVQSRFAIDLPEKMSYTVGLSAAFQGIILGVLISVLFSMLPLLQVRNIKPKLLLRDENNASIRKLDPVKWLIGALSLLGLLGLAVWQAGSVVIGAFFLAGLGLHRFAFMLPQPGLRNCSRPPFVWLVLISTIDQLALSAWESDTNNSSCCRLGRICRNCGAIVTNQSRS